MPLCSPACCSKKTRPPSSPKVIAPPAPHPEPLVSVQPPLVGSPSGTLLDFGSLTEDRRQSRSDERSFLLESSPHSSNGTPLTEADPAYSPSQVRGISMAKTVSMARTVSSAQIVRRSSSAMTWILAVSIAVLGVLGFTMRHEEAKILKMLAGGQDPGKFPEKSLVHTSIPILETGTSSSSPSTDAVEASTVVSDKTHKAPATGASLRIAGALSGSEGASMDKIKRTESHIEATDDGERSGAAAGSAMLGTALAKKLPSRGPSSTTTTSVLVASSTVVSKKMEAAAAEKLGRAVEAGSESVGASASKTKNGKARIGVIDHGERKGAAPVSTVMHTALAKKLHSGGTSATTTTSVAVATSMGAAKQEKREATKAATFGQAAGVGSGSISASADKSTHGGDHVEVMDDANRSDATAEAAVMRSTPAKNLLRAGARSARNTSKGVSSNTLLQGPPRFAMLPMTGDDRRQGKLSTHHVHQGDAHSAGSSSIPSMHEASASASNTSSSALAAQHAKVGAAVGSTVGAALAALGLGLGLGLGLPETTTAMPMTTTFALVETVLPLGSPGLHLGKMPKSDTGITSNATNEARLGVVAFGHHSGPLANVVPMGSQPGSKMTSNMTATAHSLMGHSDRDVAVAFLVVLGLALGIWCLYRPRPIRSAGKCRGVMLQHQTDDAGACERGDRSSHTAPKEASPPVLQEAPPLLQTARPAAVSEGTVDCGHWSALSQPPALGSVRFHGQGPSAQLALPQQPRGAPLAGVPKLNLEALQAAIIQEPMQGSWAAAPPALEPVASGLMALGLGAFPPAMLQEPMQGAWAAVPPTAEPVASRWVREIQEPMVPTHYY
mmetsp:Transcript_49477/g.105768  ORF Transcript_49477/g.105768 Transcript_49477/m.105768 type:complete len:840 (-) Transcript_49477:147-2666(-)